MPSYTDDMHSDNPYDEFGDSDYQDSSFDAQEFWHETGFDRWRVRLAYGRQSDLEGLDSSDYTIDNKTGEVRLKTTVEMFFRDYGTFLGIGLIYFLAKG